MWAFLVLLKWAMGNGQWAMGNGQWAMSNLQWTICNGQRAICNLQWAMGNGQWALGNLQWAMGNLQWAMVSFLRFNFRILCLKIKSIIQINLTLKNQLSAVKTITKIHNQTPKLIISR
jgi:hypothetical protein